MIFNRMLRGCLLAALGIGLSSLAAAAPPTLQLIYRFDGPEGAGPHGRLTIDPADEHVLFGITTSSNASLTGCGTVYSITLSDQGTSPTVTHKLLHRFPDDATKSGDTGCRPQGKLVYLGGFLYGTTTSGYAGKTLLEGRIFRVGVNGGFKTIAVHRPCRDLVADGGGNIYGLSGCPLLGVAPTAADTVALFRLSPDGAVTTMPLPQGVIGYGPNAGLVFGPDGWLYGSTSSKSGSTTTDIIFKVSTTGEAKAIRKFNETSSASLLSIGRLGRMAFDGVGDLLGLKVSDTDGVENELFKITPQGDYIVMTTMPRYVPRHSVTVGLDGFIYCIQQSLFRVEPLPLYKREKEPYQRTWAANQDYDMTPDRFGRLCVPASWGGIGLAGSIVRIVP